MTRIAGYFSGALTASGQAVTAPVRPVDVSTVGEPQPVANGGVGVQVAGTWTGTLTFEITRDGTNWGAVLVSNDTSAATGTTTTANGLWSVNVVGVRAFRVRASASMTGTANVVIIAAEG
jgi:hypothetical protein